MKLILLFGIFSDSNIDEIQCNSKANIQYAADALQKSIITGLIENNVKFAVVNLPFIGSYPNRYKKIYSPNESFEKLQNGSDLHNIQFCNLTGFKMWSRYHKTYKTLKRYVQANTDEPIYIIIYSVHTPHIKAAIDIKNGFKNVKIIQIVPDLPEYMNDRSNIITAFLRKVNQQILLDYYNQIDGFVLLTEAMKERLVKHGQPYAIMEGIFNNISDDFKSETELLSETKTIMYSGTLAKRYNVLDLVDAVSSLKRNDFVLEIYGDGDGRADIEILAAKDARIKYCGLRPRKDILKRQKEVTLLVNPRKPDNEYTKYSFPSKTMEYLASGTPTLIYKLDGIPKSYYKHCFTPDDSTNSALARKINEVLDMDIDCMRQFGQDARNYVLSNKNPKIQTQLLLDLIQRL